MDEVRSDALHNGAQLLASAGKRQRAEPVTDLTAQVQEARVAPGLSGAGLPGPSAKGDRNRCEGSETRDRFAGKGGGKVNLVPTLDPVGDPATGNGRTPGGYKKQFHVNSKCSIFVVCMTLGVTYARSLRVNFSQ